MPRHEFAAAFAALVQAHLARPFQWGVHDCVTFAAAAVRLATGQDPLAGLAVAWGDRQRAAALLRAQGGLRRAVQRALQPLAEPVPPGFAGVGDVVLAADPFAPRRRLLLAVCNGAHLLAPGRAGLAALPLAAGVQAWRLRHG